MIGSQSFKVLLDDWKLLQQNPTESLWVNKNVPDIMAQRFQPKAPSDLPLDYPNISSHRALFENVIAQTGVGAVVSVDFLDVKGVEAFQTVFKFRMPENELGKRYLGTLMFPFENFFCGFSFQCDEYGTTGIRENLVSLLETDGKKPETDPNKPPVILASMDEFFERIKQAPIARFLSDDEKYDELIPTHPLTRTRQYLKALVETIEFDESVRKSNPYRGINKRSSNRGFWNIFKRG